MDRLLFFYLTDLLLSGKSAGSSCESETPRITYLFLNKNYFWSNDLSGSARILANPSREPLTLLFVCRLGEKSTRAEKYFAKTISKRKDINL